jgi:hypothetical protein
MKKKKVIRMLIIISGLALFYSCDKDKCPEGSIPIRDPQGFVIDCAGPFGLEELNKTDSEEIQPLKQLAE